MAAEYVLISRFDTHMGWPAFQTRRTAKPAEIRYVRHARWVPPLGKWCRVFCLLYGGWRVSLLALPPRHPRGSCFRIPVDPLSVGTEDARPDAGALAAADR